MTGITRMFWARIFRSTGGSRRRIGVALVAWLMAASPALAADTFITLVYHDIATVPVQRDEISERDFINQLEYFRSHGYSFVSPNAILATARGSATLPEKAVLLTFDDAYASFYRFVYPALRLYNAPAILSVVSAWPDRPETSGYRTKRFMNWQQISVFTCLLEFLTSFLIDLRYEDRAFAKYYFFVIWYPAAYWIVSALAAIRGVFNYYAQFKRRGERRSSRTRISSDSEIARWLGVEARAMGGIRSARYLEVRVERNGYRIAARE